MSDVLKIFKKYMAVEGIADFKELSKQSGIKYQTLLDHINKPSLFRVFEIQSINDVLHFSSEDLITICLDS